LGAEGNALADALLGAVKYNRTSSDMTNAYGVSIYFPYQKTSNVDSAVKTYEAIGLADDYSRCIQQFASLELGGQTASASTSSPLSSLLGTYQASSPVSSDAVMELFGTLLGGSDFFGRSLDMESAAQYISENQFDATGLVWSVAGDGMRVLRLSEQQWSMINDIELNVFVDDGEGFIDLGLDNVFDFTEDGALIGEYDGTWLAINEQPVAYYHLDTVDDGVNLTITGRVPVLLNGTRADLILVFDNDNPLGYIAGARFDYRDGETDTVAKSLTELNVGDTIDFLCDYYSYSGEYIDSYLLGEQLVYDGNEFISNVYIDASSASAVYRLTDMYCGYYWTPEMTRHGN
ncbi:MAG: peptidase C11, partial [Oscillospiraceae bacterium]|nr:peptidase C11 [Oscillospiraceae bacterium]